MEIYAFDGLETVQNPALQRLNMMSKIKHLFQRFFKECGMFFPDVREFGFKIAVFRAIDFIFPRPKTESYMKALSSYMDKELSTLTEKYKNGYVFENPKEKIDMNGKIPVFVCWWQGEEKMPPIVAACVKRIKSKIPQDIARCHIITEDNYDKYVTIPEYIIEKFENGKITLVHFTDILRYTLVCTYGGMWIDSTVFLSDDFKFDFLNREYFTQRFSTPNECPHEACMGKWCNFFFSGKKDNVLFGYVYEALLVWWKKHDMLLDYIIIDYMIRSGYTGVEKIKALIDSVEPNNKEMWHLMQKLNTPYDEEEYHYIQKKSSFFKLSYKGNLKEITENGEKTIYAHIISEVENA